MIVIDAKHICVSESHYQLAIVVEVQKSAELNGMDFSESRAILGQCAIVPTGNTLEHL